MTDPMSCPFCQRGDPCSDSPHEPEAVPRRSLSCNVEGHPPVEGENAYQYTKCRDNGVVQVYIACCACRRIAVRKAKREKLRKARLMESGETA